MEIELENFFNELRNLKVAFPLNDDVIKEMEELSALRAKLAIIGKDTRSVPFWEGLTSVSKGKTRERNREAFRLEWHATLGHLKHIGTKLSESQPKWVSDETPMGWQIDQFLHAYYYNKVGEGRAKPYEDFFRRNHRAPSDALATALTWWKNTSMAPSNEDEMLEHDAPFIRKSLSPEGLSRITASEFSEVCLCVHATRDHVIKMKLSTLGRPDLQTLSREERMPLFADWLFKQRNAKGWQISELLSYVLYGGSNDELWSRLFTAARDPAYSLPHYGLNSLAEVAGWVRPEVAPPRNGRTSKALRALGYDVLIYQ